MESANLTAMCGTSSEPIRHMLFSIIINNYNYGRFVNQAIDSALNQTWPEVEVIVVDDGSKDHSREVIESYGERIKALFKENGGQGSAYNAGFTASSGDFVLFLDSDDALEPEACRKMAERFVDGICKVHFPLSIVDEKLTPLNSRMPSLKMVEGDVRNLVLTYGAYGSPPASGNCYRRTFLESVLPMPEAPWRICADSFLILQAPFYGDIATIDDELGLYRQHRKEAPKSGETASAVAGNAYGLARLLGLLSQEDDLVKEIAKRFGFPSLRTSRSRNPAYKKNLLCALLLGQAPEEAQGRLSLAFSGLSSCLTFPLYPAKTRLAGAAWFLIAGLAPRATALKTVKFALDPASRRGLGTVSRNTGSRGT